MNDRDFTSGWVPVTWKGRWGQSRDFSKARSKRLGWEAQTPLREGIKQTYAWVAEQVRQFAVIG